MREQPRRRWFRFHLLTALLMMVAAGGMIGLQFAPRTITSSHNRIELQAWGWPVEYRIVPPKEFAQWFDFRPGTNYPYPTDLNEQSLELIGSMRVADRIMGGRVIRIVFDIWVAFCILMAIAFVSEWFIRSREELAFDDNSDELNP